MDTIPKCLKLLWYDDNEVKEAAIDLHNVSTWDALRRETGHLTSFIESKLNRLRFQTRDGFDLEETFGEWNFFEGAGIHYKEILLIDPENADPCHGERRKQVSLISIFEYCPLSHRRFRAGSQA